MCSYLLIWAILSAVFDIGSTIGGRVAGAEDAANQVSLHLSYNDEFLCGGVIVSPTEVATVADRLYYSWGGVLPKIIIRIKADRNSLEDESYREFEVEEVLFHSNFDKKTLENNIAILRTAEQFSVSGLGEGINMEKNLADSKCSVTGWNQETLDLRILDVNIVECGTVSSSYLSGKICTRTNTNNATDKLCEMTEGSSLTCDNRLAGLLSIRPDCDSTDQLAVFESISFVLQAANGTVSSSANDVAAQSFRLWNIITALVSFFISLIFQHNTFT